jgi:hypothetical protein
MPNNFDIKKNLRDRIQCLINLSPNSHVISLTAFSEHDMRGIDKCSLDQMMSLIIADFTQQGYTITYDINTGCQVNICKSLLNCNSPGGQCAIDFSMRRFKRSSSTYESPTLDIF